VWQLIPRRIFCPQIYIYGKDSIDWCSDVAIPIPLSVLKRELIKNSYHIRKLQVRGNCAVWKSGPSRKRGENYSYISYVSAHEITHAFDDEGINYDSQGSVGNLYDSSTIQAFHAEADCLRQQYSQYKLQGNCIGSLQGNCVGKLQGNLRWQTTG
jgi:hypothetical protein